MRSVRFSPPPPTQIGSSSWIGRGSLRAVVRREPRALERRLLVVEQAAQDGDALLELVHARADRREVDAVGVVLDLGPPGADAHRRPAAGDQVDRRDRLGQHRRVAVADRVDERAALRRARSRRPARRAWRRPRGRRRRRAGRWRRRSGPRSRSSRSRGPRSASTAAAARRPSCAAGRCAPRSASVISSER